MSAKLEQHHVGQRAGPETSGNGEMKSAPNATLFPLSAESVERERGKAFVGASAATAVTDEQVAVLNSDFFDGAVRPRHFVQWALPIAVVDPKPGT